MSARVFGFVINAALLLSEVLIPIATVWGWIRWIRREKRWSFPAISSLSGFSLATSSALLAVLTVIYGFAIRPFPFHDPTLMKIYLWGALISLSALIFALVGVWRSSPVRWHALFCSFGMVAFWLACAAME